MEQTTTEVSDLWGRVILHFLRLEYSTWSEQIRYLDEKAL
jgi:hypothetical protein